MRHDYRLFAILIVALLTGCIREEWNQKNVMTLRSVNTSVSELPATKAHIVDGKAVAWNTYDAIRVFSDVQGPEVFWNENTATGEASSRFKGDPVSGSDFYAYFPAYEHWFNADNRYTLQMSVPSPRAGVNPELELPMVARLENGVFVFRQTLGLIHFSLKGSQTIQYLMLQGNNEEFIDGFFYVDVRNLEAGYVLDETVAVKEEYFFPSEPYTLSNEDVWDVYFAVPPIEFSKGISLNICYIENGEEKCIVKSLNQALSVKRAEVQNFTVVDLDVYIQEAEEYERNALIDLYNATNGQNWVSNTNWCTDAPLREWAGVIVGMDGHVRELSFRNNNMSGSIPESISNLTHLTYFELTESQDNMTTGFEHLFSIPTLETLLIGHANGYDRLGSDYYIEIPSSIGNLNNLRYLGVSSVKGKIPDELYSLKNLEYLFLTHYSDPTPLSPKIGNLSKLKYVSITGTDTALAGPIPEELYNCTELVLLEIVGTGLNGSLSPSISKLTKLRSLNLSGNKLSGELPKELASLHLIEDPTTFEISGWGGSPNLDLILNDFSGAVPSEFLSWPEWNYFWGNVINQNGAPLDYSTATPKAIPYDLLALNGERYTSEKLKDSELTILYTWDTSCLIAMVYAPVVDQLYKKYKDRGLLCLGCNIWDDEETIRSTIVQNGWDFPTFKATEDNFYIPQFRYFYPNRSGCNLTAFDKEGNLVFTELVQDMSDISDFVQEWFDGEQTPYQSVDYSADGTVHTLQRATEGNGIDVVLMGDAFSDRLIADGTYAAKMQAMMDALFTEEPYKSFKDYFNVYYVDVVSKNETFTEETALSTWYGEGTTVGGDDDKVFGYARNVLSEERMDEALILVMMNWDYYAGTCYMYCMKDGDYGRGPSISYFPYSSAKSVFTGVVLHEAGGHGFSKLLDEYADRNSRLEVPAETKESIVAMEPYGYGKNIDFTNDPEKVKWKLFMQDNRYADEGLGCFEGGLTYGYGVWHPTEQSIMNGNVGGFNAPSRYAIWYRIHKLAYGPEWNGTYEDFVTYDLAARTKSTKAAQAARRSYVEKPLPPLAPPVIINGSWRDAAK